MYARVIPSVRLPRKLDGIFDYSIPDDLAAKAARGSFVFVPWRGRILPGLVNDIAAARTVGVGATKPLTQVLGSARVSDDFLAALRDTAENTAASLGTVAQVFLPAVSLRTVPKGLADIDPAMPPRASDRVRTTVIIRYAAAEEKYAAVTEKAAAAARAGGSTLIITPHSAEVAILTEHVERAAIAPVIALHGGLTAPAYRRAWFAAFTAAAPVIVVGTRIAAMAPVRNLGSIVVLECESVDLRQYDQNPRFDARRIVRIRADAARADIAYLSHAPRADEYHLVKNSAFRSIEPAMAEAETLIVNPPLGAKKTFADRFGNRVHDAVEETVQKRKKVLIFHNRRGSATAYVCRECRRAVRCPTCDIALVLQVDESLQCNRCGARHATPLLCAKCGGTTLVGIGVGSQTVAALAADAFPDARIERFDTDAVAPLAERIAIADILVGTHLLLHELAEMPLAATFGAIIASDADTWLFRPGFRALEQAWRAVRLLRDIAGRDQAPLFLLTADPDNPKLRGLLDPWQVMAERELAGRAALGYPPFALQIALIVQDVREHDAKRRATETVAALGKRLGADAAVYGPFRHAIPYQRGKWRQVVLIKARNEARVLAALKHVPDEILIETNPDSISS